MCIYLYLYIYVSIYTDIYIYVDLNTYIYINIYIYQKKYIDIYGLISLSLYIYIAYAWSDKPLSIQAPHAWAVSCKRVNIYCCHCFPESLVAQESLNATMITQWSNNEGCIHDLPVLAPCEPWIPKPTDGLGSSETKRTIS